MNVTRTVKYVHTDGNKWINGCEKKKIPMQKIWFSAHKKSGPKSPLFKGELHLVISSPE